MSPGPAIAVGQLITDKYRVESVIGQGGMGVVVCATNLLTDKRVAIKRMLPRFAEDPQSVERFLREARAAGRIDHPNVVDIYDVGRDGEIPFLVMELLKGMSLSSVVGETPLEAASAIGMLMPAMRGIHAVHQLGLVHRDLKPDNIFLCQNADGTIYDVKVLDFGISKAVDEDVLPSITRTGALMGTPQYMAPEQIRGMKEIDRRTDVYALGVILYEALTGRKPFTAETFTALAVEVATATPASPRALVPDLSPALEAVVMKAIARERTARFADVASLARALEPFGGGTRFDEARPSLPIQIQTRQRFGATAETLEAGSTWPSSTTPHPDGPAELKATMQAAPRAGEPGPAARAAAPVAAPAASALTGGSIARPPMRSPMPWIAAALIVVAVVALGIYAFSGDSDVGAASETATPPGSPEPVAEPAEMPATVAPAAGTTPPEPAATGSTAAPPELPTGRDVDTPEATAGAPPEPSPTPRTRGSRAGRDRATTTRTGAATGETPPPRGSAGGAGFRTGSISVDDF